MTYFNTNFCKDLFFYIIFSIHTSLPLNKVLLMEMAPINKLNNLIRPTKRNYFLIHYNLHYMQRKKNEMQNNVLFVFLVIRDTNSYKNKKQACVM